MAIEVVLYTQDHCAESARVRAWLDDHAIAFIERNVSRSRATAEALIATGTPATPLLVADTRQVLGYRPADLTSFVHEVVAAQLLPIPPTQSINCVRSRAPTRVVRSLVWQQGVWHMNGIADALCRSIRRRTVPQCRSTRQDAWGDHPAPARP